VNSEEIDDDLPILEFYLPEVLRRFEETRTKAVRKVSRERLISTFFETRNIKQTAIICGVSPSTVRQILSRAIYTAKRIAGLWPAPHVLGDVD
jgi:DNA-directed RNA polymerase specialized sigma24 family protein